MTCDKDVERQARSREYQRNYHTRLRAKAVGNQKEHPDSSMIIAKQPGLIKTYVNYVTTILLHVINV